MWKLYSLIVDAKVEERRKKEEGVKVENELLD